MLLKDDGLITLRVFDISTFTNIGEINVWNSLIWPQNFTAFSEFELTAPVNEENKKLLKDGYVIWPEGSENAGVIEIVNPQKDEKGVQKYTIKGRTLEMFLSTRIVWGTYEAANKYPSTIMYELVDENCINPVETKRKIPFLYLDNDGEFGERISYQKTGGEIYEALNSLAIDNSLGFKIEFKPKEKKMIFKVINPEDRTRLNSQGNKPIIFDSDMQDIITSDYYSNSQDYKNVALVAGEDSGDTRKKVTVGDNDLSGFERRESYIDARDLQSETENPETENLSDEEYEALLIQRGNEKLSVLMKNETFDSSIRNVNAHYTFGVEYFIGDKITFVDRELDVIVNAQVIGVQEAYNERYSLTLTIGYDYPTLYKKIKRDFS